MLFTTHALLCLAFVTGVFGVALDTSEPQVDIKTADSDQGQAVQEESTQSTPVVSIRTTHTVTSTVVVSVPKTSPISSPAPESSAPATSPSVSPSAEPTAKRPIDLFCGTSGSANLDDCKELLKDKDGFAEKSNETYEWIYYEQQWEARQALLASAARVACHGTCCIFRHWRDNFKTDGFNLEQVRLEALELLGCANEEKHEISVLGRFEGYGVCVADWPGGPDCFDDQDWTYGENLND